MPLETANYIYDLVQANPPDTDLVQQGDDHLRLLKKVIQQTWPNITGPNLPTSTGSANAHVVTHVYGPAVYSAGQMVAFKAGFTNTGPTTINVNGGGAVTLALNGAALAAGAIVAGNSYLAIYDPALTAFAIVAGAFLSLAGGTLTTPSGVATALGFSQTGVHTWSIINQATTGQLVMFDNTTSTSRLTFDVTGTATFTSITGNPAGIAVNSPSGQTAYLVTTNARQWQTGCLPGGNYCITDATAGLNAITISGGTENVAFNGNQITLGNATTTTSLLLNKAVGAFTNQIQGQRNSLTRWAMNLGNAAAEPGSANAGSDFTITRATDAGAVIDTPISIARTSGVTTFSQPIVNGPSDRTLKENVTPLEGSLDKVLALQGVSFNFIATPDKPEIGLIAQDVEPIVPEIIQTFQISEPDDTGDKMPPKLALDYSKLTALLIEAVKTLEARVKSLETQLGV